jgi:hypothetical protein
VARWSEWRRRLRRGGAEDVLRMENQLMLSLMARKQVLVSLLKVVVLQQKPKAESESNQSLMPKTMWKMTMRVNSRDLAGKVGEVGEAPSLLEVKARRPPAPSDQFLYHRALERIM